MLQIMAIITIMEIIVPRITAIIIQARYHRTALFLIL